jgi:E1A-binding protein p400
VHDVHENIEEGAVDYNSENVMDEDDSDYEIEDEESDDEETFLEAERSESATDRKHELQLLEEEQEVPLEELRARYASMEDYDDDDYDGDDDDKDGTNDDGHLADGMIDSDRKKHSINTHEGQIPVRDASDDIDEAVVLGVDDIDEDDSDYEIEDEESDDEETFLEAERSESATDRKHELQLLEEEQEVPLEELRARYASMEDYDDDDYDGDDNDDAGTQEYSEVHSNKVVTAKEENVDEMVKRLEEVDDAARSVHVS